MPLHTCLFCQSELVVVTLSTGYYENSTEHVACVRLVSKGVTAVHIISYLCLLHCSGVYAVCLFLLYVIEAKNKPNKLIN